jgi:tetratricopeptide (TPR) repeat protein
MELAASFYRKSIAQAMAANHTGEICQTYTQYSKLFAKQGETDSALFYGREAVRIAQDRKAPALLDWAAQQLAEVYEKIDTKEALRYYKLSAAMKDSLSSTESRAQIQSLTFS